MLVRTFKHRGTKYHLHFHDFKETEHPRAKSGKNAGQFVAKGGEGETGGKSEKTFGAVNPNPPTPASGAVVVNPIALVLRKHGYVKQKGSNIWQHPNGHQVEVHAAANGQKWLTGWTHGTTGSTGSGAGRLDKHLQSISHEKPPTTTPTPTPTPTAPKPATPQSATKPLSASTKPPADSKENDERRKSHQGRIDAILKDSGVGSGQVVEYQTNPLKRKKLLTEVTNVIYDFMGVDRGHVPFSVKKMSISKIGSRKFRPGGYYTPSLNNIAMGTNNSPVNVGGLAAHELMHAKYQAVRRAYKDETARMVSYANVSNETITHPDGRVREEFQADYPLHTAMPDGFGGNTTDLIKDDGITSYSREWWKAAKEGKATIELAVNETLAEMANLDWKDELAKLTWFKESKTYKPLYELIHQHYPMVEKTWKLDY